MRRSDGAGDGRRNIDEAPRVGNFAFFFSGTACEDFSPNLYAANAAECSLRMHTEIPPGYCPCIPALFTTSAQFSICVATHCFALPLPPKGAPSPRLEMLRRKSGMT